MLNLSIPSLPVFASLAYLCVFLAGILTLAPDTAEETFVEFPDTETEDPVGAATATYPGKGRSVSLLYNFPLTLLSCS